MATLSRIEIPFTTHASCVLQAPQEVSSASPPLLVALHGQGQSGERHRRWLNGALPPHFAVAFPDGFHTHEVRRPGQPIRLGHAWYLFTGDQEAFARSLAHSEEALWRLVDQAIDALGADPDAVWLQGFSQGAYLAHCAAVRSPARVRGWIGQSGRLKDEFLGDELPGVRGKPVLVQHGREDEALAMSAAERTADVLREHGADVTLRLYDAAHVITPEMIGDMNAWLVEQQPSR